MDGTPAGFRRRIVFFSSLFTIVLAFRLCHSGILWADEDYHIAAGIQILLAKAPYRDFWYDKPPLNAWLYAAIGAPTSWLLRVFGAAYVLGICAAIFQFARQLWGEREGFIAAGLMAFFLTFDLAPAVIPAQPDFFMLLPHVVAVYYAWRGRAFFAGLWSGVAFLFNPRGIFVLAACAMLSIRSLPLILAGFVVPNAAALAVIATTGAWNSYVAQVWRWGLAYANSSPVPDPALNGVRRTLDWLGFHAALVIGAGLFWAFGGRSEKHRIAAWSLVSFAG